MGVRKISNHSAGGPPTNPFEFCLYMREQLGVDVSPSGRRKAFMGQLADEMEMNGWSYHDMVRAVGYVKEKNIRIKEPYGIFFHVNDALTASQKKDTDYDLIAGVADALAIEQDEGWVRRLSLAKGVALARVYAEWRNERGKGTV